MILLVTNKRDITMDYIVVELKNEASSTSVLIQKTCQDHTVLCQIHHLWIGVYLLMEIQ